MSDNEFFGGRRRRRGNGGDAFSPYTLFASGEQGVWYDPSDLTPEKVSWRRNLLTYSQDFENAAWTKSNASILSNLALYSQDFDNAAWTKGTDVTVTANTTTAPDGTTTADSLFETANTSTHVIFASIGHSANIATTSQIRVKPNGRTRVSFYSGGGADLCGAVFDLVGSGSVVSDLTAGVGVLTSRSISALTDGWYLLTVTGTRGANTSTSPVLALHQGTGTPTTAAPSYTGDVTKGVFLWGAQFLPGSTAQTYTRSLATAAPIQFADPLGGTLADKLIENTANNIHYQIQSLTALSPASKTYAVSAYLKDADGRFATLGISDVSTGTRYAVANFNLTNGTVASSGAEGTGYAVVSSSIENAGSGWYRCIVVCTAGTTVTSLGGVVGLSNQSAVPTGAGGFVTYTGNGTSGFFVFGAQVEQASTASAYQRITNFSSDFLAAFPTHALYQDSVGTTPVSNLGQPVGLVIDKRLGGLTNNGPELISNGGPFVNTTGWSTTSSATVSVAGDKLRVTRGATAGVQTASILLPNTLGKFYEVVMVVSSNLSAIQVAAQAYGTNALGSSVASGTITTYRVKYTSDRTANNTIFVRLETGAAGDFIDIASLSVREVPGNHAIQATLAAQPTLQARSNLLTYSEQFDNAAWTKVNVTVTANNAVAPDGTTTADTLTSTGPSVTNYINSSAISVAASTTYTASIFVKAGTSPATQLRFFDSTVTNTIARAVVQWSAGVPSLGSISGWSSTPVFLDAGNGWYRLTGTFSSGVYTSIVPLYYVDNNAIGGTSTLLWGAQLELGSTATTYQRVVTATDYADVGLPRNLTFDGVDDSLATAGNVDFATWTVGTRRNLLTVPTMFDDAAWSKGNGTVTANATAAPDGTTTADRFITTAATAATFVQQAFTSTATAYTLSAYVKPNGVQFAQLLWSAGQSTNYANFDLIAGTVGTSVATAATITDAGNGWYRIAIVSTLAAAAGAANLYCVPSASSARGASYTGDGTSGLFLWGAQLEVGSTATAFQDVGTDKVTLFSGVTKLSDAALGMMTELTTGGVAGSFYVLAPNGAASPAYQWRSSGTILVNVDSPATYAAPITNVLTGIGNISGDVATIRLNGTQAATSSADQGTGNYASALLYVGRRAGTSLQFNGRLFQLVIRGAATDSVTVGNAERWVGQLTGVAL